MIQYPGLTKKSIQLCDGIYPLYFPLLILTLLLAHRAQVSAASSGILKKDKVLTLPSVKWNSKNIANLSCLKRFYAAISILDTLSYEQDSLESLSIEQSTKYLQGKIEELSQQKKPKNARLVPIRAISEKTVEAHRHGRVAQLIGLFQSKPVFEPSSVFPNTPIANLSVSQLLASFNQTVDKLEIQRPRNDSQWTNWIASSPNPEQAEVHALELLIQKELNIGTDPIIFDDAISFGSDNNLLPIEKPFNMERPISSISPPKDLSETQKLNPFLVAAVEQKKQAFEENTIGNRSANNPIVSAKLNSTQKSAKNLKRVKRTGKSPNS